MLVSKPPKGGTLTAVGAASPDVPNNLSPFEFGVYAEMRRLSVTATERQRPHPCRPCNLA
ncbi:MAG: hypothetical protein GX456_12110 [Verrucomicrobia bacterium]|nr:hypothetical protein [Verrucomicrobiota bacterium]